MNISKINICNFRTFNEEGISLNFNKTINIVIGENNIGKSALIDALRLILSHGQYKKKLYIYPDDFHINEFGERANQITIDIFFENLTEEQGTAFYPLLGGADTSKAEMHLLYTLYKDKHGNDKIKEQITGGINNIAIPTEIFDNINLVYMPALRNVENDLKPSRNSQLASILYSVVDTEEEKDKVLKTLIQANEEIKNDHSIKLVKQIINDNLNLIEREELKQNINIELLPPTFDGIAAGLNITYFFYNKLKLLKSEFDLLIDKYNIDEEVKQKIVTELPNEFYSIDVRKMSTINDCSDLYKEIEGNINKSVIMLKQNGLGYNNILSMAAIIGDLKKKPINEEISLLLVEEPEAHLHPQLLNLLFNFFKKANYDNKMQIIITSHSPSLVAEAEIDDLIILHRNDSADERIEGLFLSKTNLSDVEKEDLKRYLDVTKSQLFFAKRILFVEGISEAILIKSMAKYLNMPLDKYAIEIVNISGVAFNVFAKLFKRETGMSYINIPCVIISDDDKCTNTEDIYFINKKELVYSEADFAKVSSKIKNGAISHRASNLLSFNSDNLIVKLANKTLEFEIASLKENNHVLLEILRPLHPDFTSNIEQSISAGEPQEIIATKFWIALRDVKGIFAQRLAGLIDNISNGNRNDEIAIPDYIKTSIECLVKNCNV